MSSDDFERSDESGGDEASPAPRLKLLFTAERFDSGVLMLVNKPRKVVQWRLKERMKTVSVALTLCLNIGVDPPDIVKTTPCARLECWIDPHSMPPPKAIDAIVKSLQAQYERWQPRAKYKHSLDPTIEDVKKLAQSLRRSAKDERVLFHYNGHGVPRPTNNGEIWVFNKNYTQYIPLSLYELQAWIGMPSIYVFDCPAAGIVVHWFLKFAEQHEQEAKKASGGLPLPQDFILLAACSANEVLPTNPDLPADLFTACLTTPIRMALNWFSRQTIISGITAEMIDKLPGRHVDRRTPLGELNWIFTAITDTIAWNVLPQDLFQKLFRQDLLVASLFRNYLLAERIMRTCMCTPVSYPKLPTTYNHPMWQAWDLAADQCLAQLPLLVADPTYDYRHSAFFTDQLTAFEVWLQFGSEDREPPEQLPVVLQVLLSQQHRLRALELLGRFLDLGPWAVNQALSVGIFPYVLKLLQSTAPELRKILVFIWAKILALDKSCQLDLVKDNGQHYFVGVLANAKVPPEERHQAAFVLSVICNNCRPGQSACLNARLLQTCLANLNNADAMLRRWSVFCLAKLWESHEEGKRAAIVENAHVQLCGLLTDPVAEVRAAAVYALGTFIGWAPSTEADEEQRTVIELNLGLTFAVVTADASPLVRKELIVALAALVQAYEDKFRQIELTALTGEKPKGTAPVPTSEGEPLDAEAEETGIYEFLWKLVLSMTLDPYPLVARIARLVVQRIRDHAYDAYAASLQAVGLAASHKGSLSPPTPAKPAPTPERSSRSLLPGAPEKRGRSKSPGPSVGAKLAGILGGGRKARAPSPKRSASVSLEEDGHTAEELVRSRLYEWSCQYFSQPLLTPKEEDQTDPAYHEKRFRARRNRAFVEEGLQLRQKWAGKKPSLENEVAILENDDRMIAQVLFLPFENVALVADDQSGITVWDWEGGSKMARFENQSAARITRLAVLNEHDNSLVAVASDDGVVRLWSGIYSTSTLNLVTAWRALNFDSDIVPIVRGAGAGLVMDWQQQHEMLAVSGNVDLIKLWDVNRELAVQDLSTQATSAVTCLTSSRSDGRTLIAGCADGSLRLFDRRAAPKYQLTTAYAEHKGWVVSACSPFGLDHQVISGASSGEVKFWDVRSGKGSLQTLTVHQHPNVTAVVIHPCAPLIAVGSQDQRIRVVTFTGEEVCLIRFHDGFLGQRIGPITALDFHPYKLLLAAGATDSIVSLYSGETPLAK